MGWRRSTRGGHIARWVQGMVVIGLLAGGLVVPTAVPHAAAADIINGTSITQNAWVVGYTTFTDDATPALNDKSISFNATRMRGIGLSEMLLDNGSVVRVVCMESAIGHVGSSPYSVRPNTANSSELDYLMWQYSSTGSNDVAAALQMLAWYLTPNNVIDPATPFPVWSNSADGFAPISPTSPEAWNALAPFSVGHPVGLKILPTGNDLDTAEALVYDLYNEANTMKGPWSLSAPTLSGATITTHLTSGTGANVPGRQVTFMLPGGGTVLATTDANGIASVSASGVNGMVQVAAAGPGVHTELAATNRQGMFAAPGSAPLSNLAAIVTNQYVAVQKVSTDTTISVAGGTFQLTDANGVVLDTWAMPANGLHVSTITPGTYTAPLTVTELVAPTGLGIAPPVVIIEPPGGYSTDPANPTMGAVDMSDSPVFDVLQIQKVVSDPTLAPGGDLSGFVFSVTRTVDGFVPGGTPATTRALDGKTPVILVPLGTYQVCEIAMPEWALATTDSPGCQTVVISGNGGSVAFSFTNTAVAASGATMVDRAVAAPGEQVLEYTWLEGAPVVGRISSYTTTFYGVPAGAAPACSAATQAGAPLVTTVIAAAAETTYAQLPWAMPATPAMDYYAVSSIVDLATGHVYFLGTCGDPLERVSLPSITTAAPSVITGTTAADNWTIAGLPTDIAATASATFDLYVLSAFSCDSTTLDSRVGTTTRSGVSNGTGTSSPVAGVVPGSAYRFVESLEVTTTRPSRPPGFTIEIPGAVAGSITTTTTIPGQGGCAESSPAPSGVTQVVDKVLVGQPARDTLVTSGFGTADLAALVYTTGPQANQQIFSEVTARWTLHVHDAAVPPTARVCTAANQIGATRVAINGDGTVTAEIADYEAAFGKQVSWSEWYEGDRLNADGTLTHWATPATGCQDPNETAVVPDLATQASAPFLNGVESSTDAVAVTGLGDGAILTDPNGKVWQVSIAGGLFSHTGDVAGWSCVVNNKLADVTPLAVPADGTYTTAPLGPDVYGEAAGGAVSYAEYFVVTRPDGSTFTGPQKGCQETAETSWVPTITTRTNETRDPGDPNSDFGVVAGAPADQQMTIRLTVYRLVPGNPQGITTTTVCDSAPAWWSVDYVVTGPGTWESPKYTIPANEVTGVQFVHQETLLIDGKVVATEACGAHPEITTVYKYYSFKKRLVRTA